MNRFLPYYVPKQRLTDPEHVALRGVTIKLHEDCGETWCPNLQLGVAENRGYSKTVRIKPPAGYADAFLLMKGRYSYERFGVTSDGRIYLLVEKGSSGQGVESYRRYVHDGIKGCVWADGSREVTAHYALLEYLHCGDSAPRVHEPRTHSRFYGPFNLNRRRGRERFFDAIPGRAGAFLLDRLSTIPRQLGWWQRMRGLRVIVRVETWGADREHQEVYVAARGLGRVAWVKREHGVDHRATAFCRVERETVPRMPERHCGLGEL